MAMLEFAILPICQYQWNVRNARKSKIYLFYLYATEKSEIQICSNKHETCLVRYAQIGGTPNFFGVTSHFFQWDSYFCQMGVLNSCFQNPSESSARGPTLENFDGALLTCKNQKRERISGK